MRRFKVQGSGLSIQGSGFRVQHSGFRVQGPGVDVGLFEEEEVVAHPGRQILGCTEKYHGARPFY